MGAYTAPRITLIGIPIWESSLVKVYFTHGGWPVQSRKCHLPCIILSQLRAMMDAPCHWDGKQVTRKGVPMGRDLA
jgi:hypothetical protein